MENAKILLPELIETVKIRLQELQYRPETIYGFTRYWKKLLEYADEHQTKYFTVTLGEDFLRDVCHIDVTAEKQAVDLPRWKVNPPKRAVYMLADFQNSGSVLRKGKEKYTPVPTCFMEITEHFYAMCRSRYNGERTIQSKKIHSRTIFTAPGTKRDWGNRRNARRQYIRLSTHDDGMVLKDYCYISWKSAAISRISLPGKVY